jgi:hypothetical protein
MLDLAIKFLALAAELAAVLVEKSGVPGTASIRAFLKSLGPAGKPPCDHVLAPDAAASSASRPAFVTTRDPPLFSERDAAYVRLIWGLGQDERLATD